MKLGDVLHLVATSATGRALGRLENYQTNSGTVIGVGDLLDIWDYLNTELPVALVTEAPKPDKPEPELEELEALEELKPEPVVVSRRLQKKRPRAEGVNQSTTGGSWRCAPKGGHTRRSRMISAAARRLSSTMSKR